MMKCDITIAELRKVCERKDYRFFETGDYNLNLIGIRSKDTSANTFNDVFVIAYKQCGRWQLLTFDCTTDPGAYWRKNPMNPLGTAVLVPGQYPSAFMLGNHKNKYDALVQSKSLPVYRDNDHDADVDINGMIDNGWHGINIHPCGLKAEEENDIGKWSAGCQVIRHFDEHQLLISLCAISKDLYGNRFTYTLLDESDF